MSQVPKLFGVSAEAAASAEAALSFSLAVPKPPFPVVTSVDQRSGDEYHRWSEVMTIQKAYIETSKSGLTTFVVEGRIRTGMPNQNKPVYSRHYMDYDVFAQGDGGDRGRKIMNDRTITALTTLTKAVNFGTPDGSLPVELLTSLFPLKDAAGTSPLKGRVVTVNLCDSPNKGDGARTDRKTQPETYNTAPGA